MKTIVLAMAICVMMSATMAGRRVPVENKSNPGRDVLRVEVVGAVDQVVGANKVLVVCVRAVAVERSKQGIEAKLRLGFEGVPMVFDLVRPSKWDDEKANVNVKRADFDVAQVDLEPGDECMFVARISVGANRDAGDLQFLQAVIDEVKFTD